MIWTQNLCLLRVEFFRLGSDVLHCHDVDETNAQSRVTLYCTVQNDWVVVDRLRVEPKREYDPGFIILVLFQYIVSALQKECEPIHFNEVTGPMCIDMVSFAASVFMITLSL